MHLPPGAPIWRERSPTLTPFLFLAFNLPRTVLLVVSGWLRRAADGWVFSFLAVRVPSFQPKELLTCLTHLLSGAGYGLGQFFL